MSNNENIINFNKYAKDFLNVMRTRLLSEQLTIQDPVKKLDGYIISFNLCEAVDVCAPSKMFIDSVSEYGEQIMCKNEDFFLSDHHVKKAETFVEQVGLVDSWCKLTPETKELFWKYIQTLYITGMSSTGKLDELNKILAKIKNK